MENKKTIVSVLIIIVLIGAVYYLTKNKEEVNTVVTNTTATSTIVGDDTNTGTSDNKNSPTVTNNTLKLGVRTLINGVYITPVSVSFDNRCPVDVKCIQAGTVDLGVLIENGTNQNTIIGLNKPIVFRSRTITLTKVYPDQVSTKKIIPSDYRFTITVQ